MICFAGSTRFTVPDIIRVSCQKVALMTQTDMTLLEAMTLLYEPLERQGPGDDAFAHVLLERLPGLPAKPQIADLGCGTGHSSLLLARHFQSSILCVDFLEPFLARLEADAAKEGLSSRIKIHAADMAALGPDFGNLDLLWSEGAAYNLTFAGALEAWRPLLKPGGIAVISEMSWFGDLRPARAARFWAEAYPQMGDEPTNLAHACAHGFEPLLVERLPSKAWWDNFYTPLLRRVEALKDHHSERLQQVLEETKKEAEIFSESSEHLGYSYYILKAI